jgi:hypothetical protein
MPLRNLRTIRLLCTDLLRVLSLTLAAAPLAGQTAGVVRGHVWSDGRGRGVPFVLVVLADADGGARRRNVLADSSGAYVFRDVAAGSYRVYVDRIGFQRQTSPVLRVAPGATVSHDFTGRQQAVTMAPITASVGCYTVDRLDQDSALQVVWNETRKGVETRRAFDRQYAYSVDLRQSTVLWPENGVLSRRDSLAERLVNDPARADQLAETRRLKRQRQGYGYTHANTLQLELPDEAELLDDDFLRRHCLETGVEMMDGAWEVSFRPVQGRKQIDVRGTIRLDSATFQVRSVSYEHVQRRRSFIRSTVEYGDVPIPGGTLRLPVKGEFEGRPPGAVGYSIRRVQGIMTFTNFRVDTLQSDPAS